MAYRNGITVTGYLLLHPAYNPSASHSLSTSPYTGEARGGGKEARFLFSRPSSKKKRVYGRNMVPPVRSRAARAAVPPGVSAETPAIKRGVPGSISPLVKRPPGGLSVHFPPVESGRMPRKTGFAGAPVDLTASVAAHSGSLRHDGGTRRRSPLCGKTAQALRGTACPSKSRPVLLDKAAPGCYSCVSKNGCHCRWRSSLL